MLTRLSLLCSAIPEGGSLVRAHSGHEDHRASEVNRDIAATQMLRPLDHERCVVCDVDGLAVLECGERVLQTGGDTTVSPAFGARPQGPLEELQTSERSPAGKIRRKRALVRRDHAHWSKKAEIVLSTHHELMQSRKYKLSAVAHSQRVRGEVHDTDVRGDIGARVHHQADLTAVDRLVAIERKANAADGKPVQLFNAKDDTLRWLWLSSSL